MNKTAIKNFSIEARRKLIASVKDKAGRIGITENQITEPISKGEGYAIFPTHIGIETKLSGKELRQRENLVNKIKSFGNSYDQVMEEVAYTWFNRIIAVRFMEVNDYLPSRIRTLSSETKGKFEPDIVTQAPNLDLELSNEEIEIILSFKEGNRMDELFKLLFIKQCNELGKVLPELFENTSKVNKDYTEILLDLSYTNEDGVIRDLLKIDEVDFLEAIEIIGWMYQYYNTEPKAKVDAYNGKKKVPKEDVPAKTQLFTPDWIVRYMVENSVGRLWLDGHPNVSLKENWAYYLDDAEQEPTAIEQLETIKHKYKNLILEEIKVLDPCMGSGHILVYAFEVLMQIYLSAGYSERDAASLIIEKNLYGLDIDNRAYQLAYFAVMMKGRKYDRHFLLKGIKPNLCAIHQSNGLLSFEHGAGQLKFSDMLKETANYLINSFRDAKEYGSLIEIEAYDYEGLSEYVEAFELSGANDIFETIWLQNISEVLPKLINQGKILSKCYDVVITNPPYFSGSDMSTKLSEYVKKEYPNSKTDMFAVFIEKGLELSKKSGLVAMITMHSWMFLSSYEKLREELSHFNLINMVHLGARAFEDISGEVVQTTSFIYRKDRVIDYNSSYVRLIDYKSEIAKKENFLLRIENSKNCYISKQENFEKIPGMPIAYWVSDSFLQAFKSGSRLGDIAKPRQGMATTNNNRFLRLWFEVSNFNIGFNLNDIEDTICEKRWFPYNKGGDFKKWYGNNDYIVNFQNKGKELCKHIDATSAVNSKGRVINREHYFKECISWSLISSGSIAFRYKPNGFIFDVAGMSCFTEHTKLIYLLALSNTKIVSCAMAVLAPTINFQAGDIANIPVLLAENQKANIIQIVEQNISLSRGDWDSFENSWDFKTHPLIEHKSGATQGQWKYRIKDSFKNWCKIAETRFDILKKNEEELNRIFIEIYNLQNDLTSEVEDKDITVHRIIENKTDEDKRIRYVLDKSEAIKTFISYAIGCVFGRYSLDFEGIAYAGGNWDSSKYNKFIPDKDNIIPITDEGYFSDDIITRFVEFIKAVYGNETLEENLDFIADALGSKGNSSREIIRNYFMKDFYKDHLKAYQKRPIYWLFDSGKENGFKALIYMHRYDEDTVGRVRTNYLHKQQGFLENAISQCDIILESSAAPSDKAKAVKQREKLVKQLAEIKLYDQAMAHIALKRIPIDLDDGVKVNYAKFQDIEVASEGKKTVKIDLLAKI